MNTGRLIFSQLMDFLPSNEFNRCVRRYHGNRRIKRFYCSDQFRCMAFAQLTYRESLRDIETCLRAVQPKLYHVGIRGHVARSTLADANETRDWRIYADFAQVLIRTARKLYAHDGFAVDLEQTAYALDSTTIDLCLTLFPWAQFRKRKSAVKLHTLLDLRGNIPCFVHITDGKVTDSVALDALVLEPAAFYIMDRGYIDFARLYRFVEHGAFFVVRSKNKLIHRRKTSRPVDETTGLRSDQTIMLTGPLTRQKYPVALRRVRYIDAETGKRFVFLTNNFTLPALVVAQLYRERWKVELFFKWIKQNLRIKAFYGTSINAVKTQVWIALSIYVLVAIMKREQEIDRSLAEILQILSITLFEKVPMATVLTNCKLQDNNMGIHNQLELFDL
jgi:hypothetical protein